MYYVGGSSYKGGDLSNGQYTYGIIIVLKRICAGKTSIGRVIIFPEAAQNKAITKSYWNSGSDLKNSGWRDFNGNEVTA